MDNILQVPCIENNNLNTCSAEEIAEIQKFKAFTATALKAAYDQLPANRTIWAPSCPFHCFAHFGEVDDAESKDYVSPAGTTTTLGEASHLLIFENFSGNNIDTVDWPMNAPCSLNGTKTTECSTSKK